MKIIQEHKKCIGCGSCVMLCPKIWEMGDDGKAKLVTGTEINDRHELETENAPDCAKAAADSCPVNCIMLQ